jgi:hypothetical protein
LLNPVICGTSIIENPAIWTVLIAGSCAQSPIELRLLRVARTVPFSRSSVGVAVKSCPSIFTADVLIELTDNARASTPPPSVFNKICPGLKISRFPEGPS